MQRVKERGPTYPSLIFTLRSEPEEDKLFMLMRRVGCYIDFPLPS